jgi:hypothetical protein
MSSQPSVVDGKFSQLLSHPFDIPTNSKSFSGEHSPIIGGTKAKAGLAEEKKAKR